MLPGFLPAENTFVVFGETFSCPEGLDVENRTRAEKGTNQQRLCLVVRNPPFVQCLDCSANLGIMGFENWGLPSSDDVRWSMVGLLCQD